MQVGFLGTFAGKFRHTSHSLAFALAFLYLLQHCVGNFGLLMEEIVHLLLDKVAHVLVHRHTTVGRHGQRTELNLRLTLKHRFFHV